MSGGRLWVCVLAVATVPSLIALAQSPVNSPPLDPPVVEQGAHRVHVRNTAKHVAYACTTCHARGGATITLDGWDPATKSCGASYCHGRFPGGVGAAMPWQSSPTSGLTCGGCHGYPPATGAHRMHAAMDRYAISCFTCHGGSDWVTHHTAGSVRVALDARAGTGARYASPTCAAVACHANGLALARDVRWTDPPLSCSGCHDDETSAAPRMSGQHARHFRLGVACADCHGAVVDRDKHIINYSLHANGRADVKVLSGRYSAGSCQPACHDPRTW